MTKETQRAYSATFGMLIGAGVGALIGLAASAESDGAEESHATHYEGDKP